MKKSDLISEFSEKNNISIADSEKLIDIIINEITFSIDKCNRSEFRGFGVFTPQLEKQERQEILRLVRALKWKKQLFQLSGWLKNFLKN